jgi:hypothetical protein
MLADSEEGDNLAGDINCGASFRVPPGARLAMLNRKGTEAAYFGPSTPSKCVADLPEDGFNNAFNVTALEVRVQLCYPFN